MVAATADGVRIVNAYVPNGGTSDSDKYVYKLKWLARLRKYFDKAFNPDELVILCGDLNVAPHELDIWNPARFKDKVHFTKPEREALLSVKRWGFADLFRQMNGEVREYSFWDHAEWSLRKDQGMRIDHIYVSPPLAERAVAATRDRDARKPSTYPGIPSDHAPIYVDFDLDVAIGEGEAA